MTVFISINKLLIKTIESKQKEVKFFLAYLRAKLVGKLVLLWFLFYYLGILTL